MGRGIFIVCASGIFCAPFTDRRDAQLYIRSGHAGVREFVTVCQYPDGGDYVTQSWGGNEFLA